MEYKKLGAAYAVRIDRGEEIVSSLVSLCEKEKITAASVSAIGAAGKIEAGLYSLETKQYFKRVYEGMFEITALLGNVTRKNGEVYTHLHISFADESGSAFGGHLNTAVVSATCEMFVTDYSPCEIGRTTDVVTELNVFKF